MAQKNNKPRERQIGKTKIEKKHLIDPKYKNTVWTIVILVILVIFFIINNTRDVPAVAQGRHQSGGSHQLVRRFFLPYPP